MYVGLTVLLGQGTIRFVMVVVTRIGLSKTVTPPTMAVVVDPAISVVTLATADVLVADALVADAAADGEGVSVVMAESKDVGGVEGLEDVTEIGKIAGS